MDFFETLFNDLIKLEKAKAEAAREIPAEEIEAKRKEVYPDEWIKAQQDNVDAMIRAAFA